MEANTTTNGDKMLAVIIEDTTNSINYFARNVAGGFDFKTTDAVAELADWNEENPNIYFHAVELPQTSRSRAGPRTFTRSRRRPAQLAERGRTSRYAPTRECDFRLAP